MDTWVDTNMTWLSWAVAIVIVVVIVALRETGVLSRSGWKLTALIAAVGAAVGLLAAIAVS